MAGIFCVDLIDLLPDTVPRTRDLIEAAELTPYATTLRYPGDEGRVTEEEFHEALRWAEAVVAWAEGLIEAAD